MKTMFFGILGVLSLSTASFAQDKNSDAILNRVSDEAPTNLSVTALKTRFSLKAEVLFLDQSGQRLLNKSGELRAWESGSGSGVLESNWITRATGYNIVLHHKWKVQDDGTIKVLIEQYEDATSDKDNKIKYVNLLKKEEFILKDFASVNWTSPKAEPGKKIIIRFIPSIKDEDEAKVFQNFPISGNDLIIYDNLNRLWGKNISVAGRYLAFTTQQGAIFLSFGPFQGAKELGTASNNIIQISADSKLMVTIQSSTPFLPRDTTAKVYGIYKAKQKIQNPASTVSVFESDKESDILKLVAN